MKLLEDILVIDFTQFLSGPVATLRLADFGARVIKIEKPITGDLCRELYVSNVEINGESSLFRAINRNKESFCADLKKDEDLKFIKKLISKADILVHNFRPGVMERYGLSFQDVKAINTSIIYAEISGYGKEGPWKHKPGQDLLLQSISGITNLSGNAHDGPVALGLPIADMFAGAHLAQGILAALLKQQEKNEGCKISVNMLESILDLQFETITTFFHDGGQPTQRTKTNNAHAYLGAPYGIYKTANGHLALAMGNISFLGELMSCEDLIPFSDIEEWYTKRDEIKSILAHHLQTKSTEHWLSILEPADIWCADVMDWERLLKHDGFKVLEMFQKVTMTDGFTYKTTRCPIRFDGEIITSNKGCPKLAEDNDKITSWLD